ncbi:MAG TPA: hypothetical protein VMB50_00225 [Myxococcales bacterium]|nr:hypothetical protein [Myxococcales bacterium]
MTPGATAPLGGSELRGPARWALVEGEAKREARVRRIGRLATLSPESLVVHLGPEVRHATLWAQVFGCRTLVIDAPPALEALRREAQALGVAELLELREGDPLAREQPELTPAADLILAQGLAAAIGFDEALAALRPSLVTDGLLAVFQRAWITSDVAAEVKRYWEAHSAGPVRTLRDTLGQFTRAGYEPMTCELVPAPAWDEYYERADARLAALASGAGAETPEGRALADLREEMRIHEQGGRVATSIGCFVGRRVEPNSPPRWPRRGFGE